MNKTHPGMGGIKIGAKKKPKLKPVSLVKFARKTRTKKVNGKKV